MRLRRAGVAAGVALASAGAAALLSSAWIPGKLVRQAEETTVDWRVRSTPERPREESPVVLVLFDSASVAGWPYLVPYPRAALADVVEAVAAARPAAIGVDVFLDRRYPRLDSIDAGDARLREAIRRAGNVVLAMGTEQRGAARALLPPAPYFAEVAAGVGTADTPTPYETVRDVTLAARADGRLVPGFALALYARAKGIGADSLLRAAERTGRLRVPGLPARYARVPRGSGVVNAPVLFLGPPSRPGEEEGAFPAFSSSTLVDLPPELLAEWFAGKVVLLGSGFHDSERFRTPYYESRRADGGIAGWTYGVEIHASALENLLGGRFPRPLPPPLRLGLLLLLAAGVSAATFRLGPWWGAAAALGLFAAEAAAAFALFAGRLVQLPVVPALLSCALAFAAANGYVSVVEGREKRTIRRMFSRYLSPTVVAELIADPSRLRLGGEKREVTVLFTDLAGFTTLAEQADPHELVELLNRYLGEMGGLVMEERGTLDKYIGDALMALYGAPGALPDHALRACRTALRMQRRLAELNREWAGRWGPLGMRVGIHTGTPIVGNVGGRQRVEYTALGDDVNLAARLEPACKTYGVGILVSDTTRAAAGDAVVVRELEVLGVVGRSEAVPVYELVALAGEELGAKAALLEHFARGLAAFRARDFACAAEHFRAAAGVAPDDRPTQLYLERCARLIAVPPPAEWTFVERQTSK